MPVAKTCPHCGKEFSVIPAKADRVYCCMSCYHKNRSITFVSKTCPQCGKEFETPKSKDSMYCSRRCMRLAFQLREQRTCPGCGKVFSIQPSHKKTYCCRKCRDAYESKMATRTVICPVCSKEFTYQAISTRPPQVCCSLRCTRKHKDRTCIERAVAQWLIDLNISFSEQHEVGHFTCDFLLSDFRLVIEADGDYWHSSPQVIARDKRKDKFLRRNGYAVLRLAEHNIQNDPDWCKWQIIANLR